MTGFDRLIEKKVQKGKKVIYWLKKAKSASVPPPSDCTHRVGGKEYADYIRIDTGVYAPLPLEKGAMPYVKNGKLSEWMEKYILRIEHEKEKISKMTVAQARERYIYVPIHRGIKLNLKYDMTYDVDMMRMNAIDLRDIMFQSAQKFWEKYGTLITAAAMIMCIIIIAYLSYEHMQKVYSHQISLCQAIIQSPNLTLPPS